MAVPIEGVLLDRGGAVFHARSYGIIPDAELQDDQGPNATLKWTTSAGQPATNNAPALFELIRLAEGKPIVLDPGRYLVSSAGVSPELLGQDAHLIGLGRVVLVSDVAQFSTTAGPASRPASLNIVRFRGARRIRLENILFHGADALTDSLKSLSDVHHTNRQALLEIRDCERVELIGIWASRHRPVYSPAGHGGGTEDPVEALNVGPIFIRASDQVQLQAGGIVGETRNEGWEIFECGSVQVRGFYSEATMISTPLNVWGPNTRAVIQAHVKYSAGSAIGIGGQDADFHVQAQLERSGGVNLTRHISSEVRGWRNAYVEIVGTEMHHVSHGFGVKAGRNLSRTWDTAQQQWTYPFGQLVVRGTIDGCVFGVNARSVESVDIDMIVRNPADVTTYGDSHAGLRGKGHYVEDCEHVRVRGSVVAAQPVEVEGAMYTPLHGVHVRDCTYVDVQVLVNGPGLTGDGLLVQPSGDAQDPAHRNKWFRSLTVGGTFIRCAPRVGEVGKRVDAVYWKNPTLVNSGNEFGLVTGASSSVYSYRVLPPIPVVIYQAGGTQSIPTGTSIRVTLSSTEHGTAGDFDLATGRITPRQRGVYLVTARIRLLNVPAARVVKLYLYKNGAPHRQMPLQEVVTGASVRDVVLEGSLVMELRDGNYCELWVDHDSGTNLIVDRAYLEASYLHPYGKTS